MKVLAISGRAQNGKDTCATMLKEFMSLDNKTSVIIHYGDLLKFLCKTFFEWDGVKNEYGRHLLQRIGTDVVRRQRPDYWVDFVSDALRMFGDLWDYVIIPDARFPNEIDKLRECGFDVTHIRIKRTNFVSPLTAEQQSHPSETALDNSKVDYLVINDRGLNELRTTIYQLLKEHIYEKE